MATTQIEASLASVTFRPRLPNTISKEAHRWEGQLHLGLVPEAYTKYRLSSEGRKRVLEATQGALQNRRLEISAALPDARVLVEELKSFRGTVSEAGH